MNHISSPVVKVDHRAKMTGTCRYVGDYPLAHDGRPYLCGKVLRSSQAKARIVSVTLPELPEDVLYVDGSDVPGENIVSIVLDDTPVFAQDKVEYIGEGIGMLVGPDEAVLEELLRKIRVEYEPLPPVLDVKKSEVAFFAYEYGHGNPEAAFSEADRIFEEEFSTGYQEQAYLEPQGIAAEPEENGKMYLHGSMQCCYYVRDAVKRALGLKDGDVHVLQDVTGGGFGGKEDIPSVLGCQAAVAAVKAKAPVRIVLSRREDLETTSKRHPSVCRCRASVKDGRITAMDWDVRLNAGAYSTLSNLVLKRCITAAAGVYSIPALHVTGRAVKTNTVPCGAFRGFGGPQMFFAVEMMMGHIANALGKDTLTFREEHLAQQGDLTSTGGIYHFQVPVSEMIAEIDFLCSYKQKYEQYAKKQSGRYRRGIGMSLFFHGSGLCGSTLEKNAIKPVLRLRKYADDTVEILASAGEIGQGIRTALCKIAAAELELPLDRVWYEHPDTGRVPDSGPTVASRTTMVVGELVRRAARRLRGEWLPGVPQETEERFVQPDYVIPFDDEKLTGDAHPAYSWGVNAVEVELDTLTGVSKILGAYGSFDVGTPIDSVIVKGQMEGGFLQGLGYACMERMAYDGRGFIRNTTFADYLIPTAKDVPDLRCILHVSEYPDGPYGAKGAGELPLVGAAPAYALAMEQALGRPAVAHIPFTMEDALKEAAKEADGRHG